MLEMNYILVCGICLFVFNVFLPQLEFKFNAGRTSFGSLPYTQHLAHSGHSNICWMNECILKQTKMYHFSYFKFVGDSKLIMHY